MIIYFVAVLQFAVRGTQNGCEIRFLTTVFPCVSVLMARRRLSTLWMTILPTLWVSISPIFFGVGDFTTTCVKFHSQIEVCMVGITPGQPPCFLWSLLGAVASELPLFTLLPHLRDYIFETVQVSGFDDVLLAHNCFRRCLPPSAALVVSRNATQRVRSWSLRDWVVLFSSCSMP